VGNFRKEGPKKEVYAWETEEDEERTETEDSAEWKAADETESDSAGVWKNPNDLGYEKGNLNEITVNYIFKPKQDAVKDDGSQE
jgi:hypothetical protein